MAVGWSLCSSESPAVPGPGVRQPLVSLRERTVARAKPAGALPGVGFGRLLGFCFFIGTGVPGRRWGESCRQPCSCLSLSWGLKAAQGAVRVEVGGSELAPLDPLGPEVRFLPLSSGFIFCLPLRPPSVWRSFKFCFFSSQVEECQRIQELILRH